MELLKPKPWPEKNSYESIGFDFNEEVVKEIESIKSKVNEIVEYVNKQSAK